MQIIQFKIKGLCSMKIQIVESIRCLKKIISLCCLLFLTQITPMGLTSQTKFSPAIKKLMAKRLAAKKLSPQIIESPNIQLPVWIETNDNEQTALASWKIDQMQELKSLLNAQLGKNSTKNPIKASMISKPQLDLLSAALDTIASGTFDDYYQSLESEYKKSLTVKTVNPGQLRTLISVAGTVKANELSALLASYFLPMDMQKYLMIPQIISPIAQYLKNEISKEGRLTKTTLVGHINPITCCDFSKDGKRLATGSSGTQDNLIIWNGETGQKLKTITVPDGNVKHVVISPDGSKVLSTSSKPTLNNENNSMQETVILWNSTTGKQIKSFDIPESLISDAEFNFDGEKIIIAASPIEPITDVNIPNDEKKIYLCIAHSNTGNIIINKNILDACCEKINPNGNTMTVSSSQGLQLYNLNTGTIITQLEGSTEQTYFESYSADGTRIIAFNFNTNTIFIWDGNTGKSITTFDNSNAQALVLNSNGTKMLVVDHNNVLSAWDVTKKETIFTFNIPANLTGYIPSDGLQFSPDNSMILVVTGAGENNIIILNAITGEQIHSFGQDKTEENYFSADFSSDSKRVKLHITGKDIEDDKHEDCITMLWDIDTKKEIVTFKAQHYLVSMSKDFLTIASPDDTNNNNFILWSSMTTKERSALTTIENNLNLNQAHFLYQLYIAKISKSQLPLTYKKQRENLPENAQDIVTKYLILAISPKVSITPQLLEPEIPIETLPITPKKITLSQSSITNPLKIQPIQQKPIPQKNWWQSLW